MRCTAYGQVLALPVGETVILTDAYFQDSEWARESWDDVERLARERGAPFMTVALHCDTHEHLRRIVTEDRDARGKITDPAYVETTRNRALLERRGDSHLDLDVTGLSATQSAQRIADWIGAG